MIWLIIIGLLGYSIYEFMGAVAMLWSITPLVLALPFMAVIDIRKWWKTRDSRRLTDERLRVWREDLQNRINRFHERYPEENDCDKNGISYTYERDERSTEPSDDRPDVRTTRRILR